MPIHSSKRFYGNFAIFLSMFCFSLESVIIRWATSPEVGLNSQFLVFVRFLLGFIVVGVVFLVKRKPFQPQGYPYLLGRAITNMFSVFLSYKAIELTSMAEGSILNMTFPVFIGIFSWMFFKKQRDIMTLLMTFVAFFGIVLVMNPGDLHIEWGYLWGLLSGICAAVSLILLNLSRQQNDTDTILLIVFGVGTFLLSIAFHRYFYLPSLTELFYLAAGGLMALLGQYLLTMGFRYVTAVEGGIASTIRIPVSALIGPYMTADPQLGLSGWSGSLIILATNIYFIVRK